MKFLSCFDVSIFPLIIDNALPFCVLQDEENDTTIPVADYAEAAGMCELTALLRNDRPSSVKRETGQHEKNEIQEECAEEEEDQEEVEKDGEVSHENDDDEKVEA